MGRREREGVALTTEGLQSRYEIAQRRREAQARAATLSKRVTYWWEEKVVLTTVLPQAHEVTRMRGRRNAKGRHPQVSSGGSCWSKGVRLALQMPR